MGRDLLLDKAVEILFLSNFECGAEQKAMFMDLWDRSLGVLQNAYCSRNGPVEELGPKELDLVLTDHTVYIGNEKLKSRMIPVSGPSNVSLR